MTVKLISDITQQPQGETLVAVDFLVGIRAWLMTSQPGIIPPYPNVFAYRTACLGELLGMFQ